MVEVETSHGLLLFVERSWLWLVFMFVMGKNRFRGGILYEERGSWCLTPAILVPSAVDTDCICMTFSTFAATSPDARSPQFADGSMNTDITPTCVQE